MKDISLRKIFCPSVRDIGSECIIGIVFYIWYWSPLWGSLMESHKHYAQALLLHAPKSVPINHRSEDVWSLLLFQHHFYFASKSDRGHGSDTSKKFLWVKYKYSLLEICWLLFTSELKERQCKFQTFKAVYFQVAEICWLRVRTLSGGQCWQLKQPENTQILPESIKALPGVHFSKEQQGKQTNKISPVGKVYFLGTVTRENH